MRLLLIRHAIAMDRGEFRGMRAGGANVDDGARPLTPAGAERMRKNAAGLRRACPRIDVLATSPLARATQTAEIVSGAYGGLRPRERGELRPGQRPSSLIGWLKSLSADGVDPGGDGKLTVAAIGHEPHLSRLLGYLVTGRDEPLFELRKGGACLLTFEKDPAAGGASLEWVLKPSLLRELR